MAIDIMNTMQSYGQKLCSDCKRVHCQKGCNCNCHWEPWQFCHVE